jgi:glycosyltransferase 2 family protein
MSRWQKIARIATSLPVRVLVSAGLLAAVAFSIDWDTVADGLAEADWWLFALSVVVFFAGFAVAAARWRALLVVAGVPTGLGASFRAYLIGMFANNLLPTGYGGDAVRAWVVAPSGKPLARSITSVIADRASALFCLILIAWVAVAFRADELPGGIVLLLGLSTLLIALGALAAFVVARRQGLGRFLPDAVREWTGEVAATIRTYERDRGLLLFVLVVGVVYQALVLAAFWLIAESLGLDLDPAILAVVVPPVLLAALLPISLAGFGVREGAFVVLLGEFGVSAADATLLSVLSVVAVTIASLPGGVAIAVGPMSLGSIRREAEADSARV